MISTFSRPAFLRLAATNPAARATSALCSGRVLMLGIRRNSFNSSSRRGSFSRTNAAILVGMGTRALFYYMALFANERRFTGVYRSESVKKAGPVAGLALPECVESE